MQFYIKACSQKQHIYLKCFIQLNFICVCVTITGLFRPHIFPTPFWFDRDEKQQKCFLNLSSPTKLDFNRKRLCYSPLQSCMSICKSVFIDLLCMWRLHNWVCLVSVIFSCRATPIASWYLRFNSFHIVCYICIVDLYKSTNYIYIKKLCIHETI